MDAVTDDKNCKIASVSGRKVFGNVSVYSGKILRKLFDCATKLIKLLVHIQNNTLRGRAKHSLHNYVVLLL